MQAELPKPCDYSAHVNDYQFDPVLMELCRSVGQLMTKVRVRERERERERESEVGGRERGW